MNAQALALSTVKVSSLKLIIFASLFPGIFVWSHPISTGNVVKDLLEQIVAFALLFVLLYVSLRKRGKHFELELFEDRVAGPGQGFLQRNRCEILITEIKKDSLPDPAKPIIIFRDQKLRIVGNGGGEIVTAYFIYDLEELRRFLFALRERVKAV